MRNILVITGGGLNTRFHTDLPKYMLPGKEARTILKEILEKSTGFDETVLIINQRHERLWNISKYIKTTLENEKIKCIILPGPTNNPVSTIFSSGVLEKYKKDKLFFKDCDTVFDLNAKIENLKKAETWVVRKFGFQVNKKYSVINSKGKVIEKPKIPWYKYLCVYKANIGCYAFPPSFLRYFMFNGEPSVGVLCGKLKPKINIIKKYKNYESLKKYGELVK